MHYLCDESNNDDKVVDEDEVEKNKLNIILASGGISQFASSSPCGHWILVSHLHICTYGIKKTKEMLSLLRIIRIHNHFYLIALWLKNLPDMFISRYVIFNDGDMHT